MTAVIIVAVCYLYLLIGGALGVVAWASFIPLADRKFQTRYPASHAAGMRSPAPVIGGVLVGLLWPPAIPVVFGVHWGLRMLNTEPDKEPVK